MVASLQFIPLFEGFVLGGSLIMAIGAQNAFVLKQGLKKEHLFLTAFTCFLCDSLLIVLGVTGIGALITDIPRLKLVMCWGGAAFLIWYAVCSFKSAFHPHVLVAAQKPLHTGKWATLLTLFGFTFLNPHTYIDTFLLIGTIGAEHPTSEHFPFIVGALSASLCWFFGLTYGASALSPLFKKPRAWQILDILIGIVMVSIAIMLLIPE